MEKILIMKTGSTIASLLAQGQDFEDWIIAGCGLDAERFNVVSVFMDEKLPSIEAVAGIIVTGSPAYVTDHAPWNERCADYLREAMGRQLPTLAICYGHQLLAYAMGGEVGFHPGGREIGTVPICLSEAAIDDRLFSNTPRSFKAQASHQQTVTRLPSDAILLASNDFDSHHAYRIGDTAWGVQFHPEFSAEIISAYLHERESALESEGLDVEKLLGEVSETPDSSRLLQRFGEIVFDT